MRRVLPIRHLPAGVILLPCILALGCQKNNQQPAWQEVKELQAERTDLQIKVEELQAENARLTEQVDTLASIDKKIRLQALDKVARIEISGRSGFYNKEKNGKAAETLIVYLRVIDEAGDAVKETGLVEVELWDLNAPENQALLGKWQVAPEELIKLWSSTIMTNYFRLTFDVGSIDLTNRHELTLKVAFTDYLTGKVLRQQAVIKP